MKEAINGWGTEVHSQLLSKLKFFGLNTFWSNFLTMLVIAAAIIIVSFIAFYIFKFVFLRYIEKHANKNERKWIALFFKYKVFHRFFHLVPAIIIYGTVPLLSISKISFVNIIVTIIMTLAVVYMIITVTFMMLGILNSLEKRYSFYEISKARPIKSYLQVVKILLYGLTIILVISMFLGKSPLYFLTGLGAMTAVFMLVFKDSIMGFAASIQLAAYDIARIGDWIEVPKYGADGSVLEISLNTIKIQNFDKTIVTIPSYALLTEGVKNWRGMSESGGRRIKRAVSLDVNSVKFCDEKLLEHLRTIDILKGPIDQRLASIADDNKQHHVNEQLPANGRHLTNLGLLRLYINTYIRNNPNIHQENFSFLIRQLAADGQGIPLELYIFANDVVWANYEAIQADIFDHLYAIIPEFDLKVYQTE